MQARTPRQVSSGVGMGMLLAVANAFVIAVGLSALEVPVHRFDMIAIVTMIGLLPALPTGAMLGWLAGRTASAGVPLRLLVLLVPSCFLVTFLGLATGLDGFVLVSFIPTTVAALILERSTRYVETPLVPAAHARR